MPGVGVILVELAMQLAKSAMVGTVLRTAIKTFIMSPLVSARDATVHASMLGMVAGMALDCVIIFVSERRGYRNGEEERGGRQKKFSSDHRYILSLEAVGDLTDYLYNLTLAAWA